MNYTRDDYRDLYNEHDEQQFSDLTAGQKLCMAVLIAAILATGLIEYEAVSVMQEVSGKREASFCPRQDADGRELMASMVMESYVKGAPKPHDCIYAYRGQ